MIEAYKVDSNPVVINGFSEHGQRGRMTSFWIFWLARIPLSCRSLLLDTNYPRVVNPFPKSKLPRYSPHLGFETYVWSPYFIRCFTLKF